MIAPRSFAHRALARHGPAIESEVPRGGAPHSGRECDAQVGGTDAQVLRGHMRAQALGRHQAVRIGLGVGQQQEIFAPQRPITSVSRSSSVAVLAKPVSTSSTMASPLCATAASSAIAGARLQGHHPLKPGGWLRACSRALSTTSSNCWTSIGLVRWRKWPAYDGLIEPLAHEGFLRGEHTHVALPSGADS